MLIKNHIQHPFPLWRYLTQPVFSTTTPLILNPTKFWQLYRMQLLIRCWENDVIENLERCLQEELEPGVVSDEQQAL